MNGDGMSKVNISVYEASVVSRLYSLMTRDALLRISILEELAGGVLLLVESP